LDSCVSPLSFLGNQQTGRAERPSFLETGANAPQFLFKLIFLNLAPQILNVSASFHQQLAVTYFPPCSHQASGSPAPWCSCRMFGIFGLNSVRMNSS